MEEISLQEYRKQIEDMVDQGRYSEAVAHGKWILQQFPRYVEAYRLLGKAMLEARQNEHATDMFLRVLSADPEDMLSWVAMSEIADRGGDMDAAVWYLERAFELATDNDLIGEELRSLYGRRDGTEPERVELTPGALARLYLRGDLLSRAIAELRALVAAHPERVDFRIALAEALWRDDQRLEASQVCQQVLERLPYCLKANLLLGEIWVNSGREEGNIYLRRAEALDPENKAAKLLLGDASPLAAREVGIAPMQHRPTKATERPGWMSEVEAASTGGPPLTDGEATLVDIAAALEAQIEIPSWLEEIDVDEDSAAPDLPELDISFQGPVTEQPPVAPLEEAPAWLADVVGDSEGATTQKPSERAAPVDGGPVAGEEDKVSEDIPDWLAGLGLAGDSASDGQAPGAAEEEDLPGFLSGLSAESGAQEASSMVEGSGEGDADWLADLREQVPEGAEAVESGAPAPAEIPDWMQSLAPSEDTTEPVAPPPEAAAGLAAETPVELSAEPVPADIPDWLQGLAPAEAAAPVEPGPPAMAEEPAMAESPFDAFGEALPPAAEPAAPAPAAEAAVTPDWLEGEGMPSGEEALAWLEQIAAGKEEELQAQVEAEIEARTAEIMGRPRPEEPQAVVPEEPVAPFEQAAPFAEEPSAAAVVGRVPEQELAPAEIPDWMQELAPTEGVEPPTMEQALVDTAPAFDQPISDVADDAFGWTGFGDVETAAAAAEPALPLAEPALDAGGMPAPSPIEQALPPVEAVPSGEAEVLPEMPPADEPGRAPEEVVAASIGEAFGWTEFGGLGQAPAAAEEAAPQAEPFAPEPVQPVLAEEIGAPQAAQPPPVVEAMPEAETFVSEPLRPVPTEEIEIPPMAELPAIEHVPTLEAAAVDELFAADESAAPPVQQAPPPSAAAPEPAAPVTHPEPLPPPAQPQPRRTEARLRMQEREVDERFAEAHAYLKENPRDYEAWLSLARGLWQTGDRKEALNAYGRLIRAGKSLETVTTELEEYVEQWPDVATRRVLGDAYMKSGKLDRALALYREALETL
jgi:tetratricopeptide (TPR) repeat protein